jgi:hypothetical protein
MLKKIKLDEAVGTKLAHDLTEIRPGEFKGAAFHKGHTVCNEDLCRLQKMGKNHLYVLDLKEDEIHEDQAAAILADALTGDGIVWKDEPREGKIKLLAWSMRSCALPCITIPWSKKMNWWPPPGQFLW